jgi:hypothetical protein
MDSEVNQLAGEYEAPVEKIEEAIAMIEAIEKISYPNI